MFEDAIADSVRYLASDAALRSIETDTYWPKWHSPWWHMVLLWELGEAQRIPAGVARAMVDGLNALPLHTFPIREEDWPPGALRFRDTACHCALGSMAQVLLACGVDVDRELPWIKPWFVRYQMRDGGLNCDEKAYLVEHECPSSMVGTIAPFEAMLALDPTSEFVERAAQFLIDRQLTLGSPTVHNAEERDAAREWTKVTFPRFYYYDVLRGARALARWAQITKRPVPDVVDRVLASLSPEVRVQRRAFASIGTWRFTDKWERVKQTTSFPLLDATSVIGEVSPTLTRQYNELRGQL